LLTGATGFLGSHLAEDLSARNYRVVALIRNTSDLWRCKEFENKNLVYVNINSGNFKETLQNYKPSVLIHAAWQGVTTKERNDQDIQMQNILFSKQLLTLANELGIKKAIYLGSQAEYGNFTGRISEEAVCSPVSAYGVAKLEVLKMFKSFCELNSIDWVWLRLFSIYGIREGSSWLIPSVIENVLMGKPMDLTKCEQRYDYMYVKDFTRAISGILETKNISGIFNLSSNSSVQLKNIVEKIKNFINPSAILNFGAMPYAPNQVMHMEGNSEKFYRQFNFKVNSDFESNLKEVITYYKNKFSQNKILNH
jgi:UDP-glucose 4-epimerase